MSISSSCPSIAIQRRRRVRVAPLLGLIAGACVAQAASAATYVRVNQVGYGSGQSARAYVMTTSSVTSESFQVLDSSGSVVHSGTVGSTTGKWGDYHVYPLDFTVSGSGNYKVKVTGTVSATSPTFRIEPASSLYQTALSNALSFYQVQRDGPDFVESTLRTAAAHLNDESAKVYKTPADDGNDTYTGALVANGQTIDASGGWADAGDYVKFVETHTYTVGVMLTGIRDFPAQMGAGSNADFTSEAEHGIKWLLKMWDDSSRTLYYQVGIGIDFKSSVSDKLSDHDFWRLPQADDKATPTSAPGFAGVSQEQLSYITHRPVLIAGAAGAQVSPNLAGRLAADFALCYQVFQTSDSSLANQCLLAAEHVYALADTSPGKLLTASPYDFYPESVWQDDMEWGATELDLALRLGGLPSGLPETSPSYYLSKAADWAKSYIGKGSFDSLNLYDVAGLAHFDLSRAMTAAGNPSLSVSQSTLLSNLKTLLDVNASSADPFDNLFTWKDGDAVSHIGGLSVMASEIANLSADTSNVAVARREAASALGANGWGVSFIIGDGTTFPDCPQHQIANLLGSHDGTGTVLAGAVVEGPTDGGTSGSLTAMKSCGGKTPYDSFDSQGATYWDWVQSYSTDEPAIDLTATSMLMFSWRMAGSPKSL